MSNPIPSSLALAVIANGQLGDATPVANNNSQIQAAVNALITAFSGGTAGQFLQAVDGSDVVWVVPSGVTLAKGYQTASRSTAGNVFATGIDLLTADLSFTADGTSDYELMVSARGWNSSNSSVAALSLKLDGAQQDTIAQDASAVNGLSASLCVRAPIRAPSAGSHTVNVRLVAGTGGTSIVIGGAGGTGVDMPIMVSVKKV